MTAGARGRSGELRLGGEAAMPPGRLASSGGGPFVVNFYNGSGKSGAQITAETANKGHPGLTGGQFGSVFLKRAALLSIYDSQAGQLPLEILTTHRRRPPGRRRRFPTQPKFVGHSTTTKAN